MTLPVQETELVHELLDLPIHQSASTSSCVPVFSLFTPHTPIAIDFYE